MRINKTLYGHVVWITKEEENDKAVIEEIQNLKKSGKVAVMVSGGENKSEIICKLLRIN